MNYGWSSAGKQVKMIGTWITWWRRWSKRLRQERDLKLIQPILVLLLIISWAKDRPENDTQLLACYWEPQTHAASIVTKHTLLVHARVVIQVDARKQILEDVFSCLRKGHLSLEFRSKSRCSKCGSKHHMLENFNSTTRPQCSTDQRNFSPSYYLDSESIRVGPQS